MAPRQLANYYSTRKVMGLLLLWLVFEPVRHCKEGVLNCQVGTLYNYLIYLCSFFNPPLMALPSTTERSETTKSDSTKRDSSYKEFRPIEKTPNKNLQKSDRKFSGHHLQPGDLQQQRDQQQQEHLDYQNLNENHGDTSMKSEARRSRENSGANP